MHESSQWRVLLRRKAGVVVAATVTNPCLERDILNFVHEVQDASGIPGECALSDVYEAIKFMCRRVRKVMSKRVCVSADSQKERETEQGDKSPVLTLVRRINRRIQCLVCDDLRDIDEDMVEYGGGNIILCRHSHGIEELEKSRCRSLVL